VTRVQNIGLNHLPQALRLLALGAAIGLLFSLIYQVISDIQQFRNTPANLPEAKIPESENLQPRLTMQQVASLHLLGQSDTKASPSITPKDLPQTRLQLVLLGTFASTKDGNASALISEKGQPAKRYFINDALPGGARLSEVRTDGVVLNRSGQKESLMFPKPSVSKRLQPWSGSAAGGPRGTNTQARQAIEVDKRTESIREQLQRLRDSQSP